MKGFDRRLWVLTAGWFINALGFSMAYPFLAMYLKSERGFSPMQVGLVFPAVGLAAIVGMFVAGKLVDTIGRRRLMIASPAIRACIFLGLSYAVHREASLTWLTILLAASGFVGAFFQIAADTYVSDLVSPEKRSDAYAVLRVGLNAGWMTGPAIGAFLAKTPFSLLFAVTAACVGSLSVLALIFCHETVDIKESSPPGISSRSRPSIALLWRNPGFLRFCILSTLLFLGSAQLVSTLSVYSIEKVNISKSLFGSLMVLNGGINFIFLVPVNASLRKMPLGRRMGLGALIYALGYCLMGLAGGYRDLFLCVALVSTAEMLVMPSSISIATRFATPGAKGRYVGLFSMTKQFGYSVGPLAGFWLYGVFAGREHLVWMVLPVFALVAGIGLITMRHDAVTGTSESVDDESPSREGGGEDD